mgnify:FL=1
MMMKILVINSISFKKRMIELLFDYLFILAYLILLALGSFVYYLISQKGMQQPTEFESQSITFFTSVLPITLIFTYLDYTKNGSFGKKKAELQLVYEKKTVQASLIRNVIKFLPWQIGHMSTIHSVYSGFDLSYFILCYTSILFLVVLLAMSIFRKDKRHLGDLLAHTQVQLKGN